MFSTEISSTGKLTNNLARRTFTDSGATEITTGSEIAGARQWSEWL